MDKQAFPKNLGKHEAFAVAYRMLVAEYRPPLVLTLYVGRRHDGRSVVAELSTQRTGLTLADLNEPAHLRFYLSPDGLVDLKEGKVFQPVGMWLFQKKRMILACLEGTPERRLEEWLAEARKELPDQKLYEVAAGYRRTRRHVMLNGRKKKVRWWTGPPRKPLQSFYLFADPAFHEPPESRLSGVLAHVGTVGTATLRRRRSHVTEEGGGPNHAARSAREK